MSVSGGLFDATLDLDQTVTCNCSRCQRLGAVLSSTSPEKIWPAQGRGVLTEYRFNTGKIRHPYCSVCGIEPFAYGVRPDGAPIVAANVNCLEGVEPREPKSTHYDGRSL